MADVVSVGPGEGATVGSPVGGEIRYKARGEETDGRLLAVETIVGPGAGPPLHVHKNEDETLYVVEGEFRFQLGDDIVAAPVGAFAFVPRGAAHTFQNVGQETGVMLVHFTPAGMERLFDDFAALEAPEPGSFAEVAARVETEVVGPPLAQA